jgi:hypothetical protein
MPSLRYGRDITDDAAFLVGERDDALKALQRKRMSAANRAAAQERLGVIEDRIKAAYGRISSAEILAREAGAFTDSYTSEGRGAAGLQDTVQTRPALSKSAQQIIRRLQKQGRLPEIRSYDENDSKSPVSIRPPRAGAAREGTRLAAAQAAQRRQIGEKAVRDKNKRNARPNIATAKAAGVPNTPKKKAK